MKKLLVILLAAAPLIASAQDSETQPEMKSAVKTEEMKQEVKEEKKEKAAEMEKAQLKAEEEVPVYTRPSFEVSEEERDMYDGIQNSMTLFIPEGDAKKVAEGWKSLMNEYKADRKITKDSKVKREDMDVNAMNIIVPQISNDLINVYANAVQKSDGVELYTTWSLSSTEAVKYETTPKKYEVAEQMMQTFASDFTRTMFEDEKKSEENVLKKTRDAHEKLVKKNKDLHNEIAKKKQEIEKANAAIKEAERNIVSNEAEQVKALEAISIQEKVLDFVQSKLSKF